MNNKLYNFRVALIFTLTLLVNSSIFAQAPEKLSYQAVIRDANDVLISNTQVGMQISVLQGSINGTVVYTETQTPTTNNNGLVSIEIGDGAGFDTIDWTNDSYFIKTETDPAGGTNYSITGTSQLLSVPYSLHSKTAESITGTINEVDPRVPNGTVAGEMQYWDGTEWTVVTTGNEGDVLTFVNNTPTWVANTTGTNLPGPFVATDATSITEESFDANWTASTGATTYFLDVNTAVDFTGTWVYNNFEVGNVTTFTATGLICGTEYFYRLRASNNTGTGTNSNIIATETNACSGGIGTVINPTTGKTWLDRNLGAAQVATSSNDPDSYGDLYQWGRGTDGHEKRTSATTTTLSSTDTPGHGDFIINGDSPFDWHVPQNDNLWQGVNGVNNPCPSGYRLPTETEWEAERGSWASNNAAGAYGSPLKLPVAGQRKYSDGTFSGVGTSGSYWSSTLSNEAGGIYSRFLNFRTSAYVISSHRATGDSVRCIQD
ncbi:hypothetical protein K8089_15795 [Aequorivita sp. F47161]|uniref:Fibronectin type-III domain-containing protein n=1 Tax=Aequorivita vitellina TaxID=2874475 RepID=A0A9X1U320_9FLAO|nr:FISUMP domain-containing protein [Aequorivita vitellina]MCG2420485.1 hypothetical protein [Aequorivita vitellina]